MENKPLNLRDEDDSRVEFMIPRKAAIAAAVILIISGIAIGALLPQLTGSERTEGPDPYSTPLSVLLSSTIDLLEVDGSVYTNVQIPVAYFILMKEGSQDMSTVDGKITEYISFLVSEDLDFKLTISTGQGWETENSHSVYNGDITSGESTTTEQEVVVDLKDGAEITLIFRLGVQVVSST